jgi:N-acetyl-anhydromuramoyl-L-alanine amidase
MPMTKRHEALWRNGWHTGARPLASPNFGPRPASALVDLIVVHSISLPPGEFGGDAVQQLFTNQLDWDAHPYYKTIEGMQVSAHFYIRRSGELWQFVSVAHRAWHAGQSSYRGRSNCNDDSVGIELEGLEGGTFERPQYQALATLCRDLAQLCPITQVAGHEHIAPGRKFDPGAGFDWGRLRQSLGWPDQCFPEETQPN